MKQVTARKKYGFGAGVGVSAAALFIVVAVSGCFDSTSKAVQPFNDAGNLGSDTSPAITIAMPDGFNNLAAKCVGHVGVYTLFHGDNTYGAAQVIPNDPNCTTGTYQDPNGISK
jgi:hypothetical protein